MGKKSEITRAKLIETARQLFLEKGFDGLKMQELADRAGMNKGLLHYYFKSKEALFRAIFREALENLFEGITDVVLSDKPLIEKLHMLVDVYFDKLQVNPHLPVFVLSEIHKNPTLEGLPFVMEKAPDVLIKFMGQLGTDFDFSKVIHMVFTVISLSIFPFVARPLLMQVIPEGLSYSDFLMQRRIHAKKVVTQLIEDL